MVVRGDFLQRVEILSHQHQLHYILRCRTRHRFRKILHRIFQPGNNCFPLVRDAFPLQPLRFRLGLRLFYQQQFIRLRPRYRRFPFALRGVNVIHRRLHFLVRHDVRNQHLDDRIAILLHRRIQVVAQVARDVRLIQERVVQLHFRHVPQHHVVDHRFDLLHRVRQFIERGLYSFRNHFVLNRNRNLHENVILRFRLDLHFELLHLHAHALHHRFQVRRLPVQPGPRYARELSQPLHDRHLRGLHGEERTQKNAQSQEANDRQQNQKKSFHGHSPPISIRVAPRIDTLAGLFTALCNFQSHFRQPLPKFVLS